MRRRLLAASIVAIALGVAAFVVPLPARLDTPGSPVVTYADGTAAAVFLAPDGRLRIPASLDRVDPHFVQALLAFEDSRFYLHPGVDPIAVARAAAQDAHAGSVVSGGSTITMQVVRVLEPRPRTLRSKAIEAVRSVQLELRRSKRQILEAYLTFAPYGRNVEGVEAASLAYFGHGADALSPAEIATLLAVPQDPTDRYPTPAHAAALKAARDDIARRLLDLGALPAPVSKEAVLFEIASTPVPDHLRPQPKDAMHAAVWLSGRHPGQRLETTLDRGIQHLTERTVANARGDLEAEGIHDIAVVVVDHRTGDVQGLVGGFDFWNTADGGQIPAFDVARSPGSALKPFLYAAAIDRGLALPERLVADVPISYGGYAPTNFDGQWSGVVRLEDALSHSLNVPFVDLLRDEGTERFLGDLRAMGATHLDPRPGFYGLSAAAGGVELTPLEMAGFYVTLADDGRPRPLRFLKSDPASLPGPEIFGPGAAFLTRRALEIRDRPDFPSRRQLGRLPPRIHWKTGTSWGFRDAWALGSGPTYTVAVWTGNLDETPSSHLIGAEASGPILFDLLEALGDGPSATATTTDSAPEELVEVEVCALSGYLPGDACPRTRKVLAKRTKVPTERCPFHQKVEIDDATGLAVTPACRAGRATHTETFVLWPPTVRHWLDASLRAQETPPSPAPGCEPVDVGPPRILAPNSSQVVLLIPGVPPDQQQVPLEGAAAASGRLAWFVDGAFLGRSDRDERLWWTPSAGHHDLVLMDDAGQSTRQDLEVR